MLKTQHVGSAIPLRIGHLSYQVFGQAEAAVAAPFLSDDKRHEFGMLPLRAGVVGIAVESEKLGQGRATDAVEKADFPPEGGRRESHRPQRVADIMLAVPERALSIFPGLAPKNGRQPDEE